MFKSRAPLVNGIDWHEFACPAYWLPVAIILRRETNMG